MKIIPSLAIVFLLAVIAKSGETPKQDIVNCRAVAKSFRTSIQGKPLERVLEILDKQVSSSPGCACELIKTAISTYKPTPEQVTVMVDTAINAAPDRMEQIVNCGIAAAPDAKAGIASKAREYGYSPNPLDYPGIPGENPGVAWQFIPDVHHIVHPPYVTPVDP